MASSNKIMYYEQISTGVKRPTFVMITKIEEGYKVSLKGEKLNSAVHVPDEVSAASIATQAVEKAITLGLV